MAVAAGEAKLGAGRAWPEGWTPAGLFFALVAAVGCLLAFAGLSTSSFWTDELFTLFVIDHDGGLGEVLRRALTDTHPPGYYFLLYGWSHLVGVSEASLRVSSAALAVGAVLLFALGTGRAFSAPARAFACAVAVTSQFWFDQSQNIRSYSLCLFVSALMLLIVQHVRRRADAGAGFPALSWAALTLLGLVGAAAHFYVFIEVGLVYLFVIVTVRSTPLRLALIGSGLAIAALNGAYMVELMRTTQQNVHQMWFRNDALFLLNQWVVTYMYLLGLVGIAALAVLAGFVVARRGARAARPPEADRVAVYGLSIHLGMVAVGCAVSVLIAPSLSSMNLATASPLLWSLLAWLYDRGMPSSATPGRPVLVGVLILATALNASILAGRFLPRNEDWRGSARFIESLPGCSGQIIPVVLPERFGPPTAFFRDLAQRWMFGRYFHHPEALKAYLPGELVDARGQPALAGLIAARAEDPRGCPVLAWGVHDLEESSALQLRDGLARLPGMAPGTVVLRNFEQYPHGVIGYFHRPGAFVFLAARPAPPAR